MSHFLREVRQHLLDSYKHRMESDCSCAMCGRGNTPLAFHVVEASFDAGTTLPESFVPLSASGDRIRGCYPICISCAPPCKKCHLPIATDNVLDFAHEVHAVGSSGYCQHFQSSILFSSIYKRIFNLGRFAHKG